jgi:hypothetical protein
LLLARPAAAWDRFEVILWHDHGPAALTAARGIGITAGMMFGLRAASVDAAPLIARGAALRDAGLDFYVENIATDFYAAYHRWQPGHPVTWRFDALRARHRADPADPDVWRRDPGLADPAWRAAIAARLTAHAKALAPLHPLFYSLGDEAGIADLSAAWDFDRAPAALTACRTWLRGQYGTLAALAAEWGSRFARWDDVTPPLTDAAVAQGGENFAAWSDGKACMDAAFAEALAAGTAALHAGDPAALSAIEGAQIPGWGGYDYTRLPFAVDAMEIYDFADAVEIATALDPALILLSSSGGGPAEVHELWHAALRGARGLILWDPDGAVADAAGTVGPRGRALAPAIAALHGEGGMRLLASRAEPGPVALLYSPPSERIAWLRDRRAEAARGGPDWSTRDAEAELADTPTRVDRHAAIGALLHAGITPRVLGPAELAAGVPAGVRVLLLVHALALSDAEADAVRRFAAAGGVVLADAPPGAFDAHGRPRAALPLADVARPLAGFAGATLWPVLTAAGVMPPVVLTHPDGTAVDDVELRLRRAVDGTLLLGALRDLPATGVDRGAETVVLTLPQPMVVRDLLAGTPALRTSRLVLTPAPSRPALLALAPG